MVALGRIERLAGLDLGDDRGGEDMRLAELGDIGGGDPRLLGVVGEDRRAILRSRVGPWG